MKIYGYARVSSQEQNLDRQLEQLKQYVSEENILCDKASGKNLERPAYQALKGALGLRAGDTLVITSIDRLSRNKEDIKQELQWFKEHKVRLMILDLPTSMIEVPKGAGMDIRNDYKYPDRSIGFYVGTGTFADS